MVTKKELIELIDVSMKQKFIEADTILRKLKTKQARDHTLHLLAKYDQIVDHDDTLNCYMIKDRYMVYRSKRLKNFKWTCQCTWRSYYPTLCSHVAVILIHNILTFGKDLVEHYLIYQVKKEIYRRLLRNRSPKFITKH